MVLLAAGFVPAAGRSADPPATHGMLVIGEDSVYLMHLPMFQNPEALKSDPPRIMPHRYQAILQATFTKPGSQDPQGAYAKDRRQHPDVRIYTIKPAEFVLPELVAAEPRKTFTAAVFRQHFEDEDRPDAVEILNGVGVNVERVVHFQEFDPAAKKPERLEYLLFGRGSEIFMAHLVTRPPDFDQVLAVTVTGHEFTKDELEKGVSLVFPESINSAGKRLKTGQESTAMIQEGASGSAPKKLQIKAGKELYFEDGELRLPAEFATTAEERAAGFP